MGIEVMVTCRTKALRRFATLGVAMIVAVTSLMLGAVPASADGYTHYENVGNPGWCLDGNGTEAYLHRCGHGDVDYQLWYFTHGSDNLQLKHAASGNCLTFLPLSAVSVGLRPCGGTGNLSLWDARGKNGWVKLINEEVSYCLAPTGTGVGGQTRYDLEVTVCDPANPDADPHDINNVPNIIAWRYFA
jgi:hypothetical protein